MPGNGHVRFGGRIEETDRWKRRHRASVRPYSWRVFTPCESNDRDNGPGNGPVKWWLWVFLGPDTACFVMDPTRSGAVLARHSGCETVQPGRGEHHAIPLPGNTDSQPVAEHSMR